MKNDLTTPSTKVRRTRVVKLRLTDSELIDLRDRSSDTALAVFIRQILFVNSTVTTKQHERKRKISDQKNVERIALNREVARIGNNLNQIARSVNISSKNNKSIDMVIVASRLYMIWEEINVLQNI